MRNRTYELRLDSIQLFKMRDVLHRYHQPNLGDWSELSVEHPTVFN